VAAVVNDLANYTPGPDCLAARERLLDGIMATWKRPVRKAKTPAPIATTSDLVTIDLSSERQAVARLYAAWQKELVNKQEATRQAAEAHSSPGDNYWAAEAKARAKWLAAANFVEMLEEARRRC
jgi:hypothetical protein